MCRASEHAANTRDAIENENLVITRGLHSTIENWLTEPGKPGCNVCIQPTALLAVQTPDGLVRGANFVQRSYPDAAGNYDFVRFLDGEQETLAVNFLPEGSGVRVLKTYWMGHKTPLILPENISSTIHAPVATAAIPNPGDTCPEGETENAEVLVSINRTGGGRSGQGEEPIVHQGRGRSRRIAFFESD